MRARLAMWLMDWAYRFVGWIDPRAVPRMTPWAFTFEAGKGAVINESGLRVDDAGRRGARLAYLDSYDYERAFTDAENPV